MGGECSDINFSLWFGFKTSEDSIETNLMTMRGVNRSTSEENDKNVEFLKFILQSEDLKSQKSFF